MKSAPKPPPYPNFIQQWRKHRGLTGADMVAALEKISKEAIGTPASLSRIEAGFQNTSLETLASIAKVLDTTIAKLMSLNPLDDRDVPEIAQKASAKRERILKNVAKILEEDDERDIG